mmetsp:Transcript_36726/g.74959  ORF Transcript_36726/g.74959 Transcript_36726/m.74959 type:complete len:81 (-) Transcript_36726:12-254(-)
MLIMSENPPTRQRLELNTHLVKSVSSCRQDNYGKQVQIKSWKNNNSRACRVWNVTITEKHPLLHAALFTRFMMSTTVIHK